MTGSFWVPIVVPIVAMITLATWFAAVFYADAHPRWKAHGTAPAAGVTGTTVRADAREQVVQRNVRTVARLEEDAKVLSVHDGSARAQSTPPRRAA